MKKILIVDDYKEEVGGTQVYLRKITPLLKEHFEVAIFQGDMPSSKLTKAFSSFFSFKYKRQIDTLIRSFKPDLIWVHSIERNVSPAFLLNKSIRDIPVILSVPDVGQYFWTKSRLMSPLFPYEVIKKLLHRCIVRSRVVAYIAVSQFMFKTLPKSLSVPSSKVFLLENPSLLTPIDSVHKPYSANLNIIFVGRLDGKKGEYILLRSISELRDLPIHLCMYGTGGLEVQIRDFVLSNDLEERVQLLGSVRSEELRQKYAESDLCAALSTVEESSSLVIREAFSQGTPVLTTALGAQSDLVINGYNGYKVELGDLGKVQSLLMRWAKDKTELRMLALNALESSRKMTLEVHLGKLLELLQSIIANDEFKSKTI